MAHKIIVSPRAQKEIENAIEYYALYSVDAPLNFITSLNEAQIKDHDFKNNTSEIIKIYKTPYFF